MRKFWLFVLGALLLTGCTAQSSSPRQEKTEADFYDCARTEGIRGASITNITPEGSFKFKIDGGGEVSISQTKLLATCMRAKGYRVDGYR
jgi:hypothetical protein